MFYTSHHPWYHCTAYIISALLLLITRRIKAEFFNVHKPDRALIILSAPSIWFVVMVLPWYEDDNYHDLFETIITFQIEFAKTIHEHDNVVILADKHTLPYLDGRSPSVKSRLPLDALIQASVYDINIRDFAPFGVRQLVKFSYRPPDFATIAARQIDESIKRFIEDYKIRIDKKELELILSGQHVVDNGINRAIIDKRALDENQGKVPEWAMMIKLFNAFRKVIIVDNPMNTTQLRLDDVMSFIDDQILVIPTLDKDMRAYLDAELFKKFRDEVMLIDLPAYLDKDKRGNCGMYTAILATDKFVYVPVFGNDPGNWKRGHSTMMDKIIIHMIEVNTRKTVVPVNVPRTICERGLSLRSLSWTLRGNVADHVIQVARGTPAKMFA
ncbi:hypothetical protein LOAG_08204 [Loa loa]|uniref:Uncharacterized protein n=1 Tax=Loa loa TaxID=7209 RepID=A0A1S0TU69_LOALO|nr:hypothetical protein LOAG_08204 [Loa loa]EFO20283.2 hypothetical protein LOAG_08204 [Loa loa]